MLARPEFLFDIGQAYQQLGHFDKALFFYRRYLSTAPGAPNRAEVEARIATLEPTVPPEARLRHIPRNEPLSAPVVVPPASPDDRDRGGDPSDGPRPRRRLWIWSAVGVAVAGAAVGLFFFSRDRGAGPPRSDLGNGRYF